ncbi:MAG: phospholipid methyltransferase [Myxococcales bacterium]|nr:phospholipid methyltransferase [Myxococcales bacterium]
MLRRLWETHVYPRVLDRVCGTADIIEERRRAMAHARGHVLEIGVGSGLNLPLFDPRHVLDVVGIDPSPPLLARAASRNAGVSVELARGVAEELPFDTARFDTAVLTYTLCSVTDPARALAEARRVLRPGGKLVFIEHGLSPDPRTARWQHRLTPIWKVVAGNCHLDRDIKRQVEAVFSIDELGDYQGHHRPGRLSFAYVGVATAR